MQFDFLHSDGLNRAVFKGLHCFQLGTSAIFMALLKPCVCSEQILTTLDDVSIDTYYSKKFVYLINCNLALHKFVQFVQEFDLHSKLYKCLGYRLNFLKNYTVLGTNYDMIL